MVLAGAEGLEPPTPGFGDRCTSNCATRLDGSFPTSGFSEAAVTARDRLAACGPVRLPHDSIRRVYSMMSATTPAPTVRPPSRIAKRSSLSIAIGVISSTVISTLSPGITISVPSGNVATPVTSVVRK